mgnify:CR=1 FL=1
MILTDQFLPFFGVVEDINDTEQLGRVRVRCYGYHTEKKDFVPTNLLRWFSSIVSNSAGTSGIGQTPTGYVTGSTVFGYFLNREMQDGIVIGSITGKPTQQALADKGFNDPNGVYPIFVDESDVNRLARNENIEETIVQSKRDNLRQGVETTDGAWDEPEVPYDAQYPDNHVHESTSGHIHEIDDTEGAERLHVYHRSGTFSEVHPNGDQVVKIVSDRYTIIAGDGYFCVEGNTSGFVGGNNDLVIKGNNNINIDGDNEIKIEGGSNITIAKDSTVDVEGSAVLRAPTIQLGEDDMVEPSVLGDKLSSWINSELVPWLNAHNHIDNLGYPTSPASTGSVGPFESGTAAPAGPVYSKINTNQ